MIPYFRFTTIALGPVQIQVWGLMVALGILTAAFVGRREAKRRGLDPELFTDLASWAVIAGLVGARLFHAFAYEPAGVFADPLSVFRVWEGGMSMFGGLLGGALGAWVFVRKHPLDFAAYADVCAYVLPLGYAIARIGCFLIHDHPGTLSHSFLAVRYPGGARLDHGLLLMIAGFALFGLFFWLNRRAARKGYGTARPSFLALFMVCYGVTRFILDFYRIRGVPGADARYLSLTPGQYVALAFIALGLLALGGVRPYLHAILQKRRP